MVDWKFPIWQKSAKLAQRSKCKIYKLLDDYHSILCICHLRNPGRLSGV